MECNGLFMVFNIYFLVYFWEECCYKNQECKGISVQVYRYLICLICYIRLYFADVNLFSVYIIIKRYFAASLWPFLSLCGCINNAQCQCLEKRQSQKSLIDFHALHESSYLLDSIWVIIHLFPHRWQRLLVKSAKRYKSSIVCARRISASRGVKRKSGSCWDADCVISAKNDACVQHKAASDRKDFMKLAGCLVSHKVWVGVGQITVCVVCALASSYRWRCKGVKGGVGETQEKLKFWTFFK